MRLTPHVSAHIYDHLQGADRQNFMQLLCYNVHDQISTGQQLRTHTQTNTNDIRPHTVQIRNERPSTKFNLVTAQSAAHGPPEDGRKYGPKHVGATTLKCF